MLYVITYYAVDTMADNSLDGVNGGLYSHQLCTSIEEAVEVRKALVDIEIKEAKENNAEYVDADAYEYEVGELNGGIKKIPDIYIDTYYDGDIVNEMIIMIEEVE